MKTNVRHNTLKVPQSEDEDLTLRRLCNALGMQRAPFVRHLIHQAVQAHVKRRASGVERPRHGHVANCPGRARVGNAFRPLRV